MAISNQELLYTMALTRLLPFNANQQHMLLDEVGSATTIYENRHDLGHMMEHFSPRAAEVLANMDKEISRCEEELHYTQEHKIKILAWQDEESYPLRLRQCSDAPLVLYKLGNADLSVQHVISIVGTRHCTERGRDLCNRLAEDLSRLRPDTLVVSGLAYGIDIAAHKAALNNRLATVGVLAHGLDEIYPRLHRSTAIEMLQQGGLLTEFMSHTKIDKVNFIQRNRIVAGLADATIVVESADHGGSLITAEMANGYCREVLAFPGRTTDTASTGCNRLIRLNEAHLITCAQDLIDTLQWEAVSKADGQAMMTFADDNTADTSLSAEEQMVLNALRTSGGETTLADLIAKCGMSVASLTPTLLTLEMKGRIRKLAGNKYHLTN